MRRGEVDWVQPLLDLVPMLRTSPGIKIESLDPFGALGILRFNHLLPPFDNAKLRQALLPAIDQQAVLAAVLGDQLQYGKIPAGFFPPESPMSSDAGMQTLTAPRSLERARELVAASGYDGQRVVMMAPSDLAAISAMSEVMQDLLTRVGLKVDYQVMDWGTMITRMNKRDPISAGGWNCYCTTWAGLTAATPGSSYPLQANGLSGSNGWPTDDTIEALRQLWFDAPDLASQRTICRAIQEAAFVSLPFIPLGEWSIPSAYRDDLTGFPPASFALFWNVRRI